MPKYKVGDVAALFPKPKKPATETQKKLQSLFAEFNTLRKQSSKDFEGTKKEEKPIAIESNEDQNQRNPAKKKKRKFSELNSSEPNIISSDKSKYKQINAQGASKSVDVDVKKKTFDSEVKDFPRKKRAKLNANNLNKNTVDNFNEIENSSDDDHIVASDTVYSNTKGSKVSGFTKKSKHQTFGSKNLNKNNSHDISLTENYKEKPKKQSNAVHESNDLFKSENEEADKSSSEKPKKKKKKLNGSMQTSQFKVQKEESGFIKLHSDEDDEERLRRTLFVGNLPVNTTRKEIEKLFSVFGPIEMIRYQRIETDRNKFFRKGGPKKRNFNYAAESLPGFVVFKERQHAVDALSLSGSIFQNHHITVDFAMPAGSKRLYDGKRSIFIGNLPFDTKDESIWNTFAECGKIEGVRVVRDRETGIGKGFGYVLFDAIQGKENALTLENVEIQGRIIRIKAVDSNKKTQKKTENIPVRRDPFKSHAIKYRKNHKDSGSRKSVKKIVKKQKELHKKKKIASLMQKSMK